MSYKVESAFLGASLPVFDGPEPEAGIITADYEIPPSIGCHPPAIKPLFKRFSSGQRAVLPMVEVETTAETKKAAPEALEAELDKLRMEMYLLARRIYGNSPDVLTIEEHIRFTNILKSANYAKGHPHAWTIHTARCFVIWPPENFIYSPTPEVPLSHPWRVRVHIPNKAHEPRSRPGEEWKFDRDCTSASCICITLADGTEYQVRLTNSGKGLKINCLPTPEGPSLYGKFWNLIKGIRVRQKHDDEVTIYSG